jgi:hypothetical protein
MGIFSYNRKEPPLKMKERIHMEYDKEKVDEIVLALLFLTSSPSESGTKAWKGLDWEVMNRLFEKGYISNPIGKAPTVTLSEEGAKLSKELFVKNFGIND